MRAFFIAIIALTTALGMAQEKSMGRQFLVKNRCFLMLQADIKAELKITKKQEERILEVFGDSIQIDGEKVMVRLNGTQSLSEITDEAVKVINAEQTKRLEEIWVQQCYGTALADEEFAKKFKLEAKQRAAVDAVIAGTSDKIQDLVTDHDQDTMMERGKQIEKLSKAAGEKMIAVLTAEQLKLYNELKGKEFKRKKKAEKD